MMDISNAALDLIKHFEGCRLKAYTCPAGVLTIGVGHTGPDVAPNMTITQAHADGLLRQDVAKFAREVNGMLEVPVNTGQFDALVSFAFNLGSGNLRSSTLLKLVNAKRFDAAAGEFGKWINANGKPLDGLRARRAAEAELFRTGQFKVPA